MERKSHVDLGGAVALTFFSLLLAFNQVVIKLTNGGFGPVFAAGLRSGLAILVLLAWIWLRSKPARLARDMLWPGLLLGGLFAFEFVCLFMALDLTTVSRTSIIFYSMPVWLALAGHVFLPNEHLTPVRLTGLLLAMAGVGVAMLDRQGGTASLIGDLAALGAALSWGGIALAVRLTPISREIPESQLLWQLVVSAPILLLVAPLFGDLLRDPNMGHVAGLVFQSVAIASLGFLFWFFLLTVYPASSVASFSFLSPVFSVLLGWWLLGEEIGPSIIAALGLVAAGLVLINRKPRS
ncbi:DMT family transporter [Shimia biformata]|uniref:DMT family transporter n=1 Tax=Shimia biformata TaxID=1294299 RepID=UPI001952469D|nr:DMT family transporter [Shimia biformata]